MFTLAVMLLLSGQEAAQPAEAGGPRCEWSARWGQLHIPSFGPEARLVGPRIRKGRIRLPVPRQKHEIDGRLTVQLAIDAKGRTVDARIVERPLVIPPWPELEESVLEDARKLKWKPATADGVAVPVCMDLPVLAAQARLPE